MSATILLRNRDQVQLVWHRLCEVVLFPSSRRTRPKGYYNTVVNVRRTRNLTAGCTDLPRQTQVHLVKHASWVSPFTSWLILTALMISSMFPVELKELYHIYYSIPWSRMCLARKNMKGRKNAVSNIHRWKRKNRLWSSPLLIASIKGKERYKTPFLIAAARAAGHSLGSPAFDLLWPRSLYLPVLLSQGEGSARLRREDCAVIILLTGLFFLVFALSTRLS